MSRREQGGEIPSHARTQEYGAVAAEQAVDDGDLPAERAVLKVPLGEVRKLELEA
jgi:hypothetical protein